MFEVDGSSTNVILGGFTMIHGNGLVATGVGGASPFDGGAILNNGSTLAVSGCTVSQNDADSGGGIYNSASTSTLTVSGCMLSGNSAVDGGGVYNGNGATATIVSSTLSGNIAEGGDYDQGDGGGIDRLRRHGDLEWL